MISRHDNTFKVDRLGRIDTFSTNSITSHMLLAEYSRIFRDSMLTLHGFLTTLPCHARARNCILWLRMKSLSHVRFISCIFPAKWFRGIRKSTRGINILDQLFCLDTSDVLADVLEKSKSTYQIIPPLDLALPSTLRPIPKPSLKYATRANETSVPQLTTVCAP